ncbi:MAG: MBL fold metallo-hydrolase [Deltaproteobacteria bacterium]|nr:MBL fold metallo-hydrolase [Deltaproteobacteria bacterium]MBW1816902.1 MBL fold metallo-hydrolase [Deltaproteobacteria bacterium]MBW2209257.1 MBL fold metallo-hydrolase [Deltaproteobacteria bacterium]
MFDYENGPVKFIHGGRYPHCHTVFIDDGPRALIDAASQEDVLLSLHRERPIETLIVSHGHEDHIMHNHLFPEADFWVHEIDAPVFSDVDRLIDSYTPESADERSKWRDALINVCHYEVREVDRRLADGDVLQFGETTCRVIHTPGHTPGHCCFHFPDQRLVFMADLDLVKAGPYYGDVGSSIEDTISSLEYLAALDVDTYLTAHGKGVYEGDPETIKRYMGVIFEREEMLLEFLEEGPKTLEEITRKGIIYGPPKIIMGFWDLALSEKYMMSKHLRRLQDQGNVILEGEHFHLK